MPRNRRVGITVTMVILALACALIVWLGSGDDEERGRSGTRSRADACRLPEGRSPEQLLAFFRERVAATAGDEAPGGSSSIVGEIVRDEDDRPLAGVPIFLVPLAIEHWDLLRDLFPHARNLQIRPPERESAVGVIAAPSRPRMAESGEDGTFTLGALAAGRYALVAHPVARPPEEITEIDVGVGDEKRVVVRSPAGRTLRGCVTDVTSGKPVAGARVSVSRSIRLSAVTDENGEYEIRGVPPLGVGVPLTPFLATRDGCPVLVRAAGYPTHEFMSIDLTDGVYTGDFELAHGTDIRGRVVDVDGHGVPEARVAASLDGALGFPDHERPWTRAVKTDADGAFRVPDLPRGRAFLIWAHADGSAPVVSPSIGIDSEADVFQAPEARQVRAGQDVTEILLTLRPAGSVRLHVVDEEGQPVEFAEIAGYRRIEGAFTQLLGPPQRRAGHRGLYELGTLPAGPYDLAVLARGWVRETIRLDVPAGETITRDVVMRRGPTVTGQVLDPGGDPLCDCAVEAWPVDDLPVGHDFMSPTDRTSEDGRFELAGLDPGREYVICAVPHANHGVSVPLHVRAGQQDIVLRARRTSVLRMRLVEDETEEPVECEEVGLRAIGEQASIARWLCPTPETDFTDRDGRVKLAGVTPGEYALEVETWFMVLVSPRTVEIPDDGSPVEIEVRLGHGDVRDFAGSVVWDDGTPAAGVAVRVVGDDPMTLRCCLVTDGKGAFEERFMPTGRHRLILSGTTSEANWLLQWGEATIGADVERVRINLGSRDRGAICVRTLDVNGRGIPGARVTLRDAAGKTLTTGAGLSEDRIRRCRAVLEGGDEFSPLFFRNSVRLSAGASLTNQFGLHMRGSLPPGPVEIEIEATGYETARLEAAIRSGEKIYREIVLERRQ